MREELSETIHLNESLGAPSARAMEKLFAAIDAEGARKRKPGLALDLRTKVAEFFSAFAPRTLAFAGAAAALVILLQAGVIGSMVLKSEHSFGVAEAPKMKVESVDFLVTFAPQVNLDQMTKFLRERHATVIDGPTGPAAMYRLRFQANGAPKDETDRVAKELQQSRSVITAEYPTSSN